LRQDDVAPRDRRPRNTDQRCASIARAGRTVLPGSDGKLDKADYERTVKTLLTGGSDPVITKEPVGACTAAITDKALAK
jgi:NitT/TauT family transport system substrate-binding protein